MVLDRVEQPGSQAAASGSAHGGHGSASQPGRFRGGAWGPPGSYGRIAAVRAPEVRRREAPCGSSSTPDVSRRLSPTGPRRRPHPRDMHVATRSVNSPAPVAGGGLRRRGGLAAVPSAQPSAGAAVPAMARGQRAGGARTPYRRRGVHSPGPRPRPQLRRGLERLSATSPTAPGRAVDLHGLRRRRRRAGPGRRAGRTCRPDRGRSSSPGGAPP